jgi:hypothetical protein
MKKIILLLIITSCCQVLYSQSTTIELRALIEKLVYDSTGYENVGNWDVANSKKIPVKWKTPGVEMSDDTSINFFRSGTLAIIMNGKTFMQAGTPVKWSIMLKGPRMGYTSFSIVSSPSKELVSKYTIDSLFDKTKYHSRLLKSCETNPVTGFYYYELKLPKKDIAFIKISWISVNGNNAVRIDCYDSYSKYAVKLNCN